MNKLRLLLIAVFISPRLMAGTVDDTIRLKNLGILPNTFENVSARVRQAFESSHNSVNTVIMFEKGRYDFWPDGAVKKELYVSNCTEDDTLSKIKNIALWLEGLDNVTIDGNGAKMVLHGKMVSFGIQKCRNITIKNLSIDYERPTMSEITIRSFSENIVEADIHPDSHYLIENGKLIFTGEGWRPWGYHAILFEPDKELMKYSTFSPFAKAEVSETAPFRVTFKGDFLKTPFKPGDVLTIRDPYRDNCGAFINRSSDVRLENLQMHYMHGLGIVSQFSENITIYKVDAAPAEKSGRIMSCFADCFHFSGCKGLVLIDSCRTSGSHDDPINVHGTHLQVTEVLPGNKIKVRFMHHQTYGFEAFITGDSITLIQPATLHEMGFAKVKSAKLLNSREMELELEESVQSGLQTGLCVENVTWTPSVTIRNCRFERTNTRGILLTTRRKILVENNMFFHTGMSAILIGDDAANWFESGMVKDVTIRGNHFINCGYNNGGAVIAVEPENAIVDLNKPVHRNIRIENNIFETYDYPVLYAKSVSGLTFTGNKIIRTQTLNPLSGNKFTFNLNGCSGVMFRDNSFEGDVLGKNIFLENMTPGQVILNKKAKTGLKLVTGNPSNI
jgi:hypothetical protein